MTLLASRLEKLRKQRGWTKVEVSRRLGMKASSTYSNWEYGNREPDNEMLAKIAKLYGVSIDYLLGNLDSPTIKSKYNSIDDLINDDSLHQWLYDLIDENPESIKQMKKVWDAIGSKNEDK